MDNTEVTKYIFIEAKPQKADLIFIFGTATYKNVAEKAYELYKKGLASKIMISGGLNEITNENESKMISEELISLGVKRKDIILEDKSTNTLENVLFSKKVIEEKIGFKNIKKVLLVVKNYHSRRAMMTFKKYFPKSVEFLPIPYKVFDFTKSSWFETEKGKEKVVGEYNKIKQYLKEGDIEEL